MVLVPIDIVKPGIRVAQAVFVDNLKFINKDAILDPETIAHLKKLGITKVWLYDEDIDPALIPDSPENLHKQITNILSDIRIKALTEGKFNLAAVSRLMRRLAEQVRKKYRPFTEIVRMKHSEQSVIEHMADVCILSTAFAKVKGMSLPEIELLATAGLLHDIGKFFIPETILNRSGELSEEDQFFLMKHTVLGHDMLVQMKGVNLLVLDVVAQHHEMLDGSGYPYGLTGDRITKYSRMVTIADNYCNLASRHPGAAALALHEVAEFLAFQGGTKLDQKLVELFLNEIVTYPLQSTVRLNTGEAARVVFQNKGFPTRPVVKIGSNKLDLSQSTTVFIEKIIELPKEDPDQFI